MLAVHGDWQSEALLWRAGEGLAEVTVRDEGRDMWQVYLDRGLFSAAFRAARTQAQRNAVNVAEAEAALVAGDTIRAARLYGKASLGDEDIFHGAAGRACCRCKSKWTAHLIFCRKTSLHRAALSTVGNHCKQASYIAALLSR